MGKPIRHEETRQAYDALLVVLAQSGDGRAAERLAIRWHPRLLRTARRLIGADLAQDVAQDSWVAIMRGLGRLRDQDRFAPWAFGILQRRCADAVRTAGRARARSAEMPEDVPADQRDELRKLDLARAMESLPREQALAAHLHYIEGLTISEIAAVQDVPPGTAKSRLFHARRALKLALLPTQADSKEKTNVQDR
ncbi:RNA polymerase sigma factor [Paraurantiacibacter namhicola]|uniref:ECF RNA polymerase sigma-E factor n=1 Tax=Paraurantiacibacter namhicola TaxID=645517 RepID=A0A1C7D7U6_9SPHN|nr:sigma-70 family RNA polymerase sigma factor [Paraurantiacibacter namhicola]ANU07391.1 ECF RNA polymerase sigma-E factor [Paraurantiacibacter namhicola]